MNSLASHQPLTFRCNFQVILRNFIGHTFPDAMLMYRIFDFIAAVVAFNSNSQSTQWVCNLTEILCSVCWRINHVNFYVCGFCVFEDVENRSIGRNETKMFLLHILHVTILNSHFPFQLHKQPEKLPNNSFESDSSTLPPSFSIHMECIHFRLNMTSCIQILFPPPFSLSWVSLLLTIQFKCYFFSVVSIRFATLSSIFEHTKITPSSSFSFHKSQIIAPLLSTSAIVSLPFMPQSSDKSNAPNDLDCLPYTLSPPPSFSLPQFFSWILSLFLSFSL
jgi:hypothetical protein